VSTVRGALRVDNEPKIATALALFEEYVDTAALERRMQVTRSTRVTPLMFEQELIERAKADRRHIVLPEGNDDRILQAAEQLRRRGVVDLTVLGGEGEVRSRAAALGLDLDGLRVVGPATSTGARSSPRR
jgi:phosphate acetyltransferase